jgi:serine protease Do
VEEHEIGEDSLQTRGYGGWLAAAGIVAPGIIGGAIGAGLAGRSSGAAVKAVPSIIQVVRPRRSDATFADVIDAKCAGIVSVAAGPGPAPAAGQDTPPVAAGVVISADGQVLTAARALPAGGSLTVILGDGRRFDARLGPADAIAGIALLKIDGADLPALEFAQRAASRTGSLGALVSTPNGAGCAVMPAMVGSDFLAEGGGQRATVRLQPVPAEVLPGTPFVAQDGSIAGIAGLDPGTDDVLPGSLAGQIASSLLRGDAGSTAAFGFEAEDVAPDLAARLGDGRLRGAMIDLVAPDTPADKAGLLAGDIVVEANGTPVSNASELSRSIALATGPVQLQVRRKSEAMVLTIKPANARGSKSG